MTQPNHSTSILISQAGAQRLAQAVNRRTFLAMAGGAAAASTFLAACGSDKEKATSGASSDAVKKSLNMFTWAEYDDPDLLKLITMRLSASGYAVQAVESGEKALACLSRARPRLVITDLKMGGMDGMALFDAIHNNIAIFDGKSALINADGEPITPFRFDGLQQLTYDAGPYTEGGFCDLTSYKFVEFINTTRKIWF